MSATPKVGKQSQTAADTVKLSEDQIYHLLQNERRRKILRYLHNVNDQVAMRDIAEQVAAWENDTTVQALASKERQRVYISLYQSHLPKLDEKGVIEYDQSRGTVRKFARAETLYNYLEPTRSNDDKEDKTKDDATPWKRYYLGASGIGATALTGMMLGVVPFTFMSQGVLCFLILGMFWTVTIGQQFA